MQKTQVLRVAARFLCGKMPGRTLARSHLRVGKCVDLVVAKRKSRRRGSENLRLEKIKVLTSYFTLFGGFYFLRNFKHFTGDNEVGVV